MVDDPRWQPPASPTALGMETGMAVPGLEDVRGTLEEALIFPPEDLEGPDDALDTVPGQSGTEGAGALPNARPEDPWDGP
jgi:hypothetical protein